MTFHRPIIRTTALQTERPVNLVYPETEPAIQASEALAMRLDELGIASARRGDLSVAEWEKAGGSGVTILLGNLGESRMVRELYYRVLVVTDKTYPGPGGFELRTLCDPLGKGENILYLGYSDTAGLEHGVQALVNALADPVPYLNKVEANQLPLPEHEEAMIRSAVVPEPAWRASSDVACMNKGYLGYLRGDAKLLEAYMEIWEAILDYGIEPGDHNIKDLHLRMVHLISSFRLLDAAGLIPESKQERIYSFFLKWVESDQGLAHIRKPEFTQPGLMRQNHGFIPALALAYLADIMAVHFPGVQDTGPWWEVIEEVYRPYADGSWKPACEGLCHGWYLSQPAMLEFGLLDPDRRYFENGGARAAADCAMAVVNNLGWLPSSGDSHLLRSFPGVNLRMAAATYGDGRYAFVDGLTEPYRRLKSHIFLTRSFDSGVTPEVPESAIGVTVVPLDPVVYRTGESAGSSATHYFQTRPGIPLERCFDKLAFRSGWGRNDAYLLMDGLGGGSHAYLDALEIVDYTSHGYTFIASETGGLHPETESHGVLTLYRDGLACKVPEFAELMDAEYTEDGRGYARAALREYNGAEWIREVFFYGTDGFAVVDTVRAMEPGLYTVESHFRIPGSVVQTSEGVQAERTRPGESTVYFSLTGYSSHEPQTFIRTQDKSRRIRDRDESAGHCFPEESLVTAWERRYGIEEKVITIYAKRITARLEPGETVTTVHGGAACKGASPVAEIRSHKPGEYALVQGEVKRQLNSREEQRPADPRAAVFFQANPEPGMGGHFIHTFNAPVHTLSTTDGGHFTAGIGESQIAVLNGYTGEPMIFEVPDPVHTLRSFGGAGTREGVFVSHGDCCISEYNTNGDLMWTHQITAIPSSSPWWELDDCRAAALDVLWDSEGEPLCVGGCGDMHVRGFDGGGTQQWAFRYQNGVPARLMRFRLPGFLQPLLATAGEILSNQSTVRILDADGKLKLEIPVEGWTSKLRSMHCFEMNRETYLACGASRGLNFQVHHLKGDPQTGAITSTPVIRHYAGGAVTAVSFCPVSELLLAGTDQGILMAFELDGSLAWTRVFSEAVQRILIQRDRIFIGCADGIGILLDSSGSVLKSVRVDADWAQLLQLDDRCLLPVGNSIQEWNPFK